MQEGGIVCESGRRGSCIGSSGRRGIVFESALLDGGIVCDEGVVGGLFVKAAEGEMVCVDKNGQE